MLTAARGGMDLGILERLCKGAWTVSPLLFEIRSAWLWGPRGAGRTAGGGGGLISEWVGPVSPSLSCSCPYLVALRLGPWLPRREARLLGRCPLRWPRAPPRRAYIARGRSPRAARRNVSPLLGPYLGVGHWRPSHSLVRGLGPPPGFPALTIEGAAWPAPRYRGPGRIWCVSPPGREGPGRSEGQRPRLWLHLSCPEPPAPPRPLCAQ